MTIYNKLVSYLCRTFAYLKKHCLLPIAAMFLPSLVACFLSTPYWEVSFMTAFDYHPYQSGAATFTIMFGDSWQYVWPVIVVAVFQVFGAALIMSAVDKHFRTGKMTMRSPWRLINNSIFPIAIGVAIMSVLSIILRFLLYGLVMLVQVIGNSCGFPAGVSLAVIAVVAVGLFIVHVLIISPILFWAPIMFIYGYKFRDAAALSFKMLSGKKVFRGLFLPMLICAGIQLLIGFLQVHAVIAGVVGFVVFMFTNVYTTVYIMITFYEISGLERRDIAPYRAPLPVPPKKPDPPVAEPTVSAESSSDITQNDAEKARDKTEPETPVAPKKRTSGKKSPARKTDKPQRTNRSSGKKPSASKKQRSDTSKNAKASAVNSAERGEGGGDVV